MGIREDEVINKEKKKSQNQIFWKRKNKTKKTAPSLCWLLLVTYLFIHLKLPLAFPSLLRD